MSNSSYASAICLIKNELQKFILTDDGRIKLENNKNLCITVSQNNSVQGGGGNPVHLIRKIELQNCDMNLSSYQTWGIRS